MKYVRAFTLIELAIAISIIGIIAGMILSRSGSVIGNAEATATITIINDLAAAVKNFKSKYQYMPGDLPLAGNQIQNTSEVCNIPINTPSIGNGKIDTQAEVACATEHIVNSGMIKGSSNGIFTSNNSQVTITARRGASLLSSSVINEIQITNLSCDTARTVDLKLDDGDFSKGKITASVASCIPNDANDPVPILDIAI